MNKLKIALKEVSPIVVAYIFLGIAAGIFIEEMGMTPFNVFVSSVLLYSGSLSFVLGPLLVAGVPLGMIALMTLFVNGRHIFYSVASLKKYSIHPFWERIYMALTLTDEVYSVEVNPRYGKDTKDMRTLGLLVHFIGHSIWIISNMIGAFAGDILPVDLTGIEFSALAFFFIVVIEQYLVFPTKIPLVIGLVSAVVTFVVMGPDDFILPAMIVSIVLLVIFRTTIDEKIGVEDGQ